MQANPFEPRKRARRRALQALYQWQITGHAAGEILDQFRSAQDMSGVDEAHFERLLRGVIADQPGLDDALEPFLDRPVAQLDLMERAILRIGAFELLNCPETPYRVVDGRMHRSRPTSVPSRIQLRQRAVLDRLARRQCRGASGRSHRGNPNAWRPDVRVRTDPVFPQEIICAPGARATGREKSTLGIGDDGAVLELPPQQPPLQLVACTDTLVEGVHFPLGTAPAAIGHKALAVNLSDLAAMGAEPAWFLLALTLPAAAPAWLEPFAQGMARLASTASIFLAGGDVASGPLNVCITALGLVEKGRALTRSGAAAGDLVVVSGRPGAAAHALATLQSGRVPDPRDLAALEFPQPRLGLAVCARATGHRCFRRPAGRPRPCPGGLSGRGTEPACCPAPRAWPFAEAERRRCKWPRR
jgi:transcription antitermination factor NusB